MNDFCRKCAEDLLPGGVGVVIDDKLYCPSCAEKVSHQSSLGKALLYAIRRIPRDFKELKNLYAEMLVDVPILALTVGFCSCGIVALLIYGALTYLGEPTQQEIPADVWQPPADTQTEETYEYQGHYGDRGIK